MLCTRIQSNTLEADIIKFFDTIDAKNLLDKVKAALSDDSINRLLDGAVTQELSNVEELRSKKVYELYFQAQKRAYLKAMLYLHF
jgi:retron-type reverse transcriptase